MLFKHTPVRPLSNRQIITVLSQSELNTFVYANIKHAVLAGYIQLLHYIIMLLFADEVIIIVKRFKYIFICKFCTLFSFHKGYNVFSKRKKNEYIHMIQKQ